MSGMFGNSGSKLRIVAIVGFVIQIIALVISFIAQLIDGSFLLGLLILAIGFLVAYIETLFIVTIADSENNSDGLMGSIWELKKQIKELQDKIDAIKFESSDTAERIPQISQTADTVHAAENEMISCPACGKSQYGSNGRCYSCGSDLK